MHIDYVKMTRKLYSFLLNALGRMKKSEALRRAYKEQQIDYIILSENHRVTE